MEAVADGVDALDAVLFHDENGNGSNQYAPKRTRYLAQAWHFLQCLGREDDDQQRTDGNDEVPKVERPNVLGITNPFAHKVARRLQGDADDFASRTDGGLRQAQYVADLRREDGQGDTCREAYDDRIGDELDDHAQPESTKCDENDACQNGRNQQALQAVFRVVDNAVDDDDKGSCRASNLHFSAAEQGDEETSHNGRYNAFFGGYAACYAESDG